MEECNFFDFNKKVKKYTKGNIQTVFSEKYGYEEEHIIHSKDVLRIGKQKYDVYHMRPFRREGELLMNIKKSSRKMVYGMTGCGKSFLFRGIIDRFIRSGGYVINLSDVKGEMISSLNPVQEKFRFNLARGDKPTGLAIREYYPAYLNKRKPKNNIKLMQIPLKEMTLEDLQTCITGIKMSDTQLNLLEKCLIVEQDKKYPSIRGLIDVVNNSDMFSGTKTALILRLENLEASEAVGETYEPMDIAQDFKEKYMVSLNLSGYAGTKNLTSFYIGFYIRKLIELKDSGRIPISKRVLVVLDEMGDFCPPDKDLVSRTEIEELFRKGRIYNIYIIGATQKINFVSDKIFEQLDGCFMPNMSYIDLEDMKYIIKKKIRPDLSPNAIPQEVPRILNKKLCKINKDGTRDWFYADFVGRKFKIFTPYSPLSAHMEEKGT
ncbi:MAG: hypothetical protein DRP06_01655 [Candidatus Aenigmatarchaeota archaeon]|nr:MAG: hypothetical protein DRP06_01655 [Candidatus Aenigmarchaeota archaeon]